MEICFHQSEAGLGTVTPHQFGISTPVSQTSYREDTSRDVAKCRLFSQANLTSHFNLLLQLQLQLEFLPPSVSQTSYREDTSRDVAKCRLFSQANLTAHLNL